MSKKRRGGYSSKPTPELVGNLDSALRKSIYDLERLDPLIPGMLHAKAEFVEAAHWASLSLKRLRKHLNASRSNRVTGRAIATVCRNMNFVKLLECIDGLADIEDSWTLQEVPLIEEEVRFLLKTLPRIQERTAALRRAFPGNHQETPTRARQALNPTGTNKNPTRYF